MTWFTPLAPFLIIDAYKRSERLSEDGRLRRFWKIPHSDPMIWGQLLKCCGIWQSA